MISGTGFLAVAAREAAENATAAAEKKAERAAERAAKRNKAALEAAKKETEKAKQEALQLKTRLTVMQSWNKSFSPELITDNVDLTYEEVCQLITVFENLKTHSYSKTDVDINELVKLSGLTEFEVKIFLILLK